jgi:LemA protein
MVKSGSAIVFSGCASIQSFPAVLIAQKFGFGPREFFDVGEPERKQLDAPPSVKF